VGGAVGGPLGRPEHLRVGVRPSLARLSLMRMRPFCPPLRTSSALGTSAAGIPTMSPMVAGPRLSGELSTRTVLSGLAFTWPLPLPGTAPRMGDRTVRAPLPLALAEHLDGLPWRRGQRQLQSLIGSGLRGATPAGGPPVLSHPMTCLSREPAVPAANL
jgi:hypothetical protein